MRWYKPKDYLLEDTFEGPDVAAGSVNGTPASDGYNTRTVVDTDSKLSISGSKLNIAPRLTPAWGDPLIRYAAVAQQAGRVFIVGLNASVIADSQIGFSKTTGGDMGAGHYYYLLNSQILVRQGGANVSVGPVLITNTDYQMCVVERATGCFYFIKGGIYTTRKLLWISATTSDPLYPAVFNSSATFASNGILLPRTLWLPQPLASDSFTRANGALGDTDGAGHAETTGLGSGGSEKVWTSQIGTVQINGNAAIASALVGGAAIATVPCGEPDVMITGALTRGTDTGGLILRYVDADNYIYAVHDGANAELHKVVGGVDTALVDVAAAYGAGNKLRVTADGTKFRLYYNDTFIGTEQTIADAALQTSGLHGVYYTDTDSAMDDFTGYACHHHKVPEE